MSKWAQAYLEELSRLTELPKDIDKQPGRSAYLRTSPGISN
jgi:hypothetical protein